MKSFRILYAGDSAIGGPANYLLGILNHLKARVDHIPPSLRLSRSQLSKGYDAIIFSDYSRKNVSPILQEKIGRAVQGGTGFLMAGGWSSFSGPFGGWRGSAIEKILPIHCLDRDDRVHFSGGAYLVKEQNHSMLRGLSFRPSPVIVGMNRLKPKQGSAVLVSAQKISQRRNGLGLDSTRDPLLIIDSQKKAAALATDPAPHWCGGWVDWGSRRMKLAVHGAIQIEVGDLYVRFFSSLIRWLCQ